MKELKQLINEAFILTQQEIVQAAYRGEDTRHLGGKLVAYNEVLGSLKEEEEVSGEEDGGSNKVPKKPKASKKKKG